MTEAVDRSSNGAPDAPSFQARGVSQEYDGRVVLAPLDLDVAAGERVAVIGPSGAGKTTLLRLLGAVLWPSTGSVRTLGRDTTGLRGRALRELRRDLGFLHQHDNLVPGLRVAHNVLMGHLGRWSTWTAIRSLFAPKQIDTAMAALREVELDNALWSLPSQLSGGERQRVAIARLILQQPKALLADEPVSSLDIRLGRDVIERLCGLASRRDASLVVSLHTLDLLGYFDRVLALRGGHRVWEGAPGQLTAEILADIYGTEYRTLRLQEMDLDEMDPDAP